MTDQPEIPDGDPVLVGAILVLAAIGYLLEGLKR